MNNTVTPQLSVPQWLQFSAEVRTKLREKFNIPKSGGSEVQYLGGKAVQTSDGHTHADLQVVNLKSLQEATSSDSTDFYGLLNRLVDDLSQIKRKTTEELVKEANEKFLGRVTNMLVTINLEAKEIGLEGEVQKLFELAHGKINSTVKKIGKKKND